MLKVAVLVSGGGTNLQAILDAIDSGRITNAEVSLVISNNPNAYALERAKNHGIEAVCISPGTVKEIAGKRSRTDCSCRLSGCNSTYDRGGISK